MEGHDDLCTEMIAPPVQSVREARELVELTLELLEEYLQEHSVMSSLQLGVVPVTDLIDFNPQFNNERLIFTVGGGAGLLFGIFSVLLCWHQIAAMLRLKERSIGILRSLGATERFVFRLLTGETLFLRGAIFLAALLGTVLLYDLWLAPATAVGSFGVSFLVFNGWTVLILAALSFAVPLLSTLVPLKKFLKKPVVENITGK